MIERLVLVLKGAVDATARGLPGLLNRIQTAAKATIGALVAVTGAITAMTIAATASVDALGKEARALGTTAAELQAFRLAADLAGVSQEQFLQGARALTNAFAQASAGSKDAQAALHAVGLTARDAKRPITETFAEVLDGLNAMPEGARRAKAGTVLLGEGFLTMATLIEGGSESIRAAREEIASMGATIDDEAVAASERFTDALTLLRFRMGAVSTHVGLKFAPALEEAVTILSRLVDIGAPAVLRATSAAAFLAERGVKSLNHPVGQLAAAASAVTVTSGLFAGIGKIAELAKSGKLGVAAKAIAGMFSGVTLAAAAPFVAVAAAIAAIVLAIDDLIAFSQGGDSVFGRMLDEAGELGDDLRALGNDVLALYNELKADPEVVAFLSDVGDALSTITSTVIELGRAFIRYKIFQGLRDFASLYSFAKGVITGDESTEAATTNASTRAANSQPPGRGGGDVTIREGDRTYQINGATDPRAVAREIEHLENQRNARRKEYGST